MNRPLIIGNVHNLSLESYSDEQPQLVAQFPCKTTVLECFHNAYYFGGFEFKDICCAIIWFHDVSLIVAKTLNITMQSSNMTGLFFQKVVNVSVELVELYSQSTDLPQYGIAIAESHLVEIHSSIANNWQKGVIALNVSNINISNMTTSANVQVGIMIYDSFNVYISNTATKSGINGIFIATGNNILITATTSTYSYDGIRFFNVSNAKIINSNASHNAYAGIHLYKTTNTHIINTTTSHNKYGLCALLSNRVDIYGITATNNDENGIGLFLMAATNITKFTTVNNSMNGNISSTNGQILIHISKDIRVDDTVISVNTSGTSGVELITQPAVIVVYRSTLKLSRCIFTRNRMSAIKALDSNITLAGELTFSHNRAFSGTAFILVQNSILILADNCRVYFVNNHATNTGGVFALSNNEQVYDVILNVLQIQPCFFHPGIYVNKTRFWFGNNSAGNGGDILYGGNIAFQFIKYTNCLELFKRISNISETSLSLLSSDPLRVCLCNQSGLPDCMLLVDPTPHSIYPGQTISISAVVVGQDWGTVAGSAYAQFLHKSTSENKINLEYSQVVQSIGQHSCNTLQYTMLTMNEGTQNSLVLTAKYMYVSYFQNGYNNVKMTREYNNSLSIFHYRSNPVYISISLLPCPPGFHIRSSKPFKCDCNKLLQQILGVQCFIQEQIIGRSGLVWVGTIDDDNGTNGTVAASQYCPLNYCSKVASNVTLSESDSQCNYNHSGTLCGGCQPGLSLALGSAQCLPCSNDYLALLIPFTLAGPALVGFIKFVDLTISQGSLNGLVFYVNIIQVNQNIFFPWRSPHPFILFIAWLNLDLGVEMCFFNGLDAYTKTWLQFVFPLYVWSIAGLIIILAKYSNRLAKLMGNNSVPVLATLFLLSHAKLFRTIIAALSYTILCTSHSCKAVWSADGHLDYLGPKHASLFVVSVVTLVFLWLPYTLLLFGGQWLHMCRSRLIVRMLIKLKPFLDTHYGALKDRHHYWFGALHLMRAIVLLISALLPSDHSSVVAISILSSAVVLMLFASIVYRGAIVSVFNMAFYMNLVLFAGANLYITISGGDPAVAAYTLIGMAFLQFFVLVIFKLVCILRKCPKVNEYVKMRRPVDDDWELYEEAALLREMESDTKEQDKENSGSTESYPSY